MVGFQISLCVLSCPLFAPSPAAPSSQALANHRRQPLRYQAPASPSRAPHSLPPREPPQALLRHPPPAPNLPSPHSLLTPHSPPPSQHLRAQPASPAVSVQPRMLLPTLPPLCVVRLPSPAVPRRPCP